MSGYHVTTPSTFVSVDPVQQLLDKVSLMQNTISVPEHQTNYDSDTSVTYSADALVGGYIVRTGLVQNTEDYLPTATEIINALKRKCAGVANYTELPNGTSFICKLWNKTEQAMFFHSHNGVLIGGLPNQITSHATCVIEFIINDQASLGPGHTDAVFACLSRCAYAISYD